MSQTTTSQSAEPKEGDRLRLRSLFQKIGNGQYMGDMSKDKDGSRLKPQSHLTKIEKIPIIWDGERLEPEARRIPGLGRPNSSKLKFPPELTKTIIRLANEPPPMVNYLSYVTHTDVRSWSAASNMTLVHQILGDARPSWRARLQGFMKKTSRRIMGKQSTSDRQGSTATVTGPIYESHHDVDDFDEEDEDGLEVAFSFRHNGRYRRWRRGRGKRNKNLWELRDVDFLELLLLFYTSTKIESLSLGMNCSHWYHPSLNVLIRGIPEQLSGLRRIVIDHADTIAHSALPVPQLFIQRHQKAFPGQLREIQVRQSYHYSYDMSKSVLQTIKTMDRLEVLDLSIWTGVFSGLESICTVHLRKLLICHHMDVPRPEMFDELLKRCPVLEELSIIVPHPRLFSWAVKRRADIGTSTGTMAMAAATTTKMQCRKSLLSSRAASIWSDPHARRPAYLPPLKTLTLFGHTPDVVGAFKDVIFAFQDTLESIQVSMYSDMTKPPESHLEVPPPHFMVADENPQSQFFGVSIHQDPMQSSASPFNAAPVASQSTLNPYNASPELSALWHQEILTGINASHNPSSSTNTSPPIPPSYLTWNWPLPRLRTMSLRGPVVAYFDMQLLRFCPQLTDLALSYHCSRLPRLVYPGTTTSSPGTASTLNRYPRIMVCDSLAFKWGMNPQEDRHSMVIV
ncbi:hypothetical protein BGZ58_008455 [Dissophora ornata]|nr:hypothetical protein BGZ58_008455 [Dissophora ornata]